MARLVNLGDPIPTHRRAYFDVRLNDGITPALGEVGGQPQISTNGGGWTNVGIGTLAAIGDGRYFADLDINTVSGNVGDVVLTRYQGAATAETPGDSFQVSGEALAPAPITGIIPSISYCAISDANVYFASRLHAEAWDDADDTDKQKALNQATRLIDRLNYAGDKADPDQPLQFPRSNSYIDIPLTTGLPTTVTTTDATVPDDIKIACYEIALQLIDEVDVEMEVSNLGSIAHGISTVRTHYDRQWVEEHIRHGIPSAVAWSYLVPYLRDMRQMTLSRAN